MNAHDPKNPPSPMTLPPQAPCLRLSAEHGDEPVARETDAPLLLLGARRDCHLALPHPDVSKIHAAIVNTGRSVLVRDLLSRTGTFVNDEIIQTAVLKPGDALRVGPVEIAIEAVREADVGAEDGDDPLRLATPLTLEVGEERREVTESGVIIGRRNSADVFIDTPDVSLAHALIFSLDGWPAICDLGSRSGTFVNGQRVDLSWLRDGDQVEIGGEQVTVHWDETALADTDVAGEVTEAAPVAVAPEAQPAVVPGASGGSLADLERTIAAVHNQISTARARIDEQSQELEGREARLAAQLAELEERGAALDQAETAVAERESQLAAKAESAEQTLQAAAAQEQVLAKERAALERSRGELDARMVELEGQRGALEAAQAGLTKERDEVEHARAALEQQQQAINEATEAACQQEDELRQRAEELEGHAAQLAEERSGLEAQQADFAAQRDVQAEAAAQLEQQLAELEPFRRDLAAREESLAQREQDLAEREAQHAEALQKIEQFKTVLSQAGALFTTPGGEAPSGGDKPALAKPGHAGNGSGDADAAEEELPAPVVDAPIFSPTATGPPADWPPELRERFRVLRRMSRKSDEELLAQVWADRERLLANPDSTPSDSKKKRSFWGN